MVAFVKLTRVYKTKSVVNAAGRVTTPSEMKTQTITVATSAITSVRASNRLGYPEHRSTITLAGGAEIDLADKFSEVNAMLGVR